MWEGNNEDGGISLRGSLGWEELMMADTEGRSKGVGSTLDGEGCVNEGGRGQLGC